MRTHTHPTSTPTRRQPIPVTSAIPTPITIYSCFTAALLLLVSRGKRPTQMKTAKLLTQHFEPLKKRRKRKNKGLTRTLLLPLIPFPCLWQGIISPSICHLFNKGQRWRITVAEYGRWWGGGYQSPGLPQEAACGSQVVRQIMALSPQETLGRMRGTRPTLTHIHWPQETWVARNLVDGQVEPPIHGRINQLWIRSSVYEPYLINQKYCTDFFLTL